MSLIKKSPGNALIKDVIKGLKQQGVADEDLIAGVTKGGIPGDMARSLVARVADELEIEGLETSRSLVRTEIDSALFEWGKEFGARVDERLDGLSEDTERLKIESKKLRNDQAKCLKELESIKGGVKEIESSVKSFEIYAKEILKELKK